MTQHGAHVDGGEHPAGSYFIHLYGGAARTVKTPRPSLVGKMALKIAASLLLFAFVVIPLALRVAGVAALSPVSLVTGTALSRIVLALCTGLLVGLVIRAAGWKRALIGIVGLGIAAGAVWVYSTTIWRDEEYRRVTDEFKNAMPLPKRADIGDGRSGWNESISIANGVRANLRAGDHLDIATIGYSDEASPRKLFAPTDYINIPDVRRRGAVLYVLRSITLLRVEYRLTVYDVNHRVVIADRRVEVADMK